jgi:hypothetical protein
VLVDHVPSVRVPPRSGSQCASTQICIGRQNAYVDVAGR